MRAWIGRIGGPAVEPPAAIPEAVARVLDLAGELARRGPQGRMLAGTVERLVRPRVRAVYAQTAQIAASGRPLATAALSVAVGRVVETLRSTETFVYPTRGRVWIAGTEPGEAWCVGIDRGRKPCLARIATDRRPGWSRHLVTAVRDPGMLPRRPRRAPAVIVPADPAGVDRLVGTRDERLHGVCVLVPAERDMLRDVARAVERAGGRPLAPLLAVSPPGAPPRAAITTELATGIPTVPAEGWSRGLDDARRLAGLPPLEDVLFVVDRIVLLHGVPGAVVWGVEPPWDVRG